MTNIKYNKIITKSTTGGNSKIQCEKCGKIKRIRHMTNYQGHILCSNCKPNIIGSAGFRKGFSMEKALNRVYTVYGFGVRVKTKNLGRQPVIQAKINVPSVLVGHKVKLVLIE